MAMSEATVTDIRKTVGVGKNGKTIETTRVDFEYKGGHYFIIIPGTPTNDEIAEAIRDYIKKHLGLLGHTIKV